MAVKFKEIASIASNTFSSTLGGLGALVGAFIGFNDFIWQPDSGNENMWLAVYAIFAFALMAAAIPFVLFGIPTIIFRLLRNGELFGKLIGVVILVLLIAGITYIGSNVYKENEQSDTQQANNGTVRGTTGKVTNPASDRSATSMEHHGSQHKRSVREKAAAAKIAKFDRPGCNVCRDVIKRGARLTPEHMAIFKLSPDRPNEGEERFYAICSGLQEYCSDFSMGW